MNALAHQSKYTREQLLKMSGMMTGNTDFIQYMYINPSVEDKEGNELKPGTFTFKYKEKDKDPVQVYSLRKNKETGYDGSITFRPYVKAYIYEGYDSEKKATVCRSIIFKDFKEEIIADNGLPKAGAKSDKLPSTTKVKCKNLIFGDVSFDGVKADGTPISIVNEPVFIKIGGGGFSDCNDFFKDFGKTGKKIFLYDLKLIAKNLEAAKYVTQYDWADLTKEHEFDEVTMKTLENFAEYIDLNNKRLEAKWKRLIDKAGTPEENADPIVDDLASDFVETVIDDGSDE